MRPKYIEERYPRWFIFGHRVDGSGVDISDGECDVATGIPERAAGELIKEHNRIVDALVEAVMDLTPEKQHEWLATHQRSGG